MPPAPAPVPDQYKTPANLLARAGLHRFSTAQVAWFDWLFDHMLGADLPTDARIADIGAGPGAYFKHNAARIPPGWQIAHTDASPAMVEDACRTIDRAGSTFAVVDAAALPWPDASFDAVLANHVLYHVPDRLEAIAELARVLVPGGRLFASTVSVTSMQALRDLAASFNATGHGVIEVWPVPGFTLESGGAELAPAFADISMPVFRDELVVTEAEPLAAYLCSRGDADERTRAALVAFIQARLDRAGPVHIGVRNGTFLATKRSLSSPCAS